MEGRWERAAVGVGKWAFIPLALFGFGYFVIGPWMSGGPEARKPAARADTSLVNQQPIQPGERRWIPVSPPQVDISVTRSEPEEEELSPDYPYESEPPPIEIPDDEDVDEAGVGGIAPPTTTGGDSGTVGERKDKNNSADTDSFRRPFKGIGSER
jgi:hypothetical protein